MPAQATDQSNLQDEKLVELLYIQLLESWNKMNAHNYANQFTENANLIGFDGSQVNGRDEIFNHISYIFTNHKVASYVYIIRGTRSIGSSVFILRAVVGMVPPGQSDIKPDVNAVQTLVAEKQGGKFKIAVFQNTPAAFHGRPELSKQLTEELRNAFKEKVSG